MCICQTSTLYDYVIMNLKDGHTCSGEWIMKYGCDVTSQDRSENPAVLISYEPARSIKAFTVGEAQRLVEYEHGGRRPIHRVLELTDEGWTQIVPCSQSKSQAQIDKEIEVMKKYGLWKDV